MPKAWLPFPPDHRYAGKFYEGFLPEGAPLKLAEAAGGTLKQPSSKDIIPPELVVSDELADANAKWAALADDLKRVGKSSVVVLLERTVDTHSQQVAERLDAGDVAGARGVLEQLEATVAKGFAMLGDVIPVQAVTPADMEEPRKVGRPKKSEPIDAE